MDDYRAIMTGTALVCGLACASGIWPAVDGIASTLFAVLVGLGGLVVAGHVAREVWRELLFRAAEHIADTIV